MSLTDDLIEKLAESIVATKMETNCNKLPENTVRDGNEFENIVSKQYHGLQPKSPQSVEIHESRGQSDSGQFKFKMYLTL